MGLPAGSVVNERIHLANAGNARDTGSISGLGRSPGGGYGNSLQSSLENSMVRGARWALVHGVTELDTTEQQQAT